MHYIVCVGAIYIDTVLTVPDFPREDQKIRATSEVRRRGGNCGNTLEVLDQLINDTDDPASEDCNARLISVLPGALSQDYAFIRKSLGKQALENTCIFHDQSEEAARSYIIRNRKNGSRTIVSYNPLEEMTLAEFQESAAYLRRKDGWFHFEGRIPDVVLGCVQFLRNSSHFTGFRISVELEKPERTGLVHVAREADVVFYSKLWAENQGYTSAREFLSSQIPFMRDDALLCCTWGADGATVVQRSSHQPDSSTWGSVPAWNPEDPPKQVVDSIGAGDTFVAGMLFALSHHKEDWSLGQKLAFANELAGRKVFQEGFDGIVEGFKREHALRNLI